MKILIVDDNGDDRNILRHVIEREGHEVLEAEDGKIGLEMALEYLPDLIISDGFMPYMDGFQLLRSIKQLPQLNKIPFIFYSASYKEVADMRLADALGADKYILKPVDPSDLWNKLEAIIATKSPSKMVTGELILEDSDYLKRYCEVVALKLEKKVKELEETLADKKRTEEKLLSSLREKEAMVQELYHRTKNTIIVIQSIIALQSERYGGNAEVKSLVLAVENRIQGIFLVHQLLYRSRNLSQIPMEDYIHELTRYFLQSYKASDRVGVDVRSSGLVFLLDTAVPLGLILNELLSNSLRHGFKGQKKGLISIIITRIGTKQFLLKYSDDGTGFAQDSDVPNPTTLGLNLVRKIGEGQLQGKVTLSGPPGMTCEILFSEGNFTTRI